MGTVERSSRLSSTAVAFMLAIASPVLAQEEPSVPAGDADTVYVASPTGDKETDRASILAALEEVRPGGTVQFAPATYLIGEAITVAVPKVTLLGHPEGTTLRGCEPSGFGDRDFAVTECNGFNLTGGDQAVRDLTFEYTWHSLILGGQPCKAGDCPPETLPVEARSGGYVVERNTFRESQNGIRVVGQWQEPAMIRDNQFINTYHAVVVNGMTAHIVDNHISVPVAERVPNTRHPGLALMIGGWEAQGAPACDRNIIAGNRIAGHPDAIAILLFPGGTCRDNVIRDNTIEMSRVRFESPSTAIHVRSTADSTVAGVPLALLNGVFGDGLIERNLIEGNRIIGAEGLAIEVLGASGNRIVDNTVIGVASRDPFPGNTLFPDAPEWVDANGSGIWISPESEENEITGNTFEDVTAYAVFLEGDRNRVKLRSASDTVRDLGRDTEVTTTTSAGAGETSYWRNPLPPGAQAAEERLVFPTFRPANWDIYHFAARGDSPKRLTEHPGLDYDPVLSPDGRWVVFTSERAGSPDLFALDQRGGDPPRLLIESDALEDQATFSPDGRTLVFVGTRDGSADLFSLPFQPERTRSLADAVNLSRHPAGEFRPAISPDGRWIAFSSDREHPASNANPIGRLRGGDLFLMPAGGGPARRLTRTEGWAGSPAWSLDGETLYFYRREIESRTPRFSLWAIRPNGGPAETEPWKVLGDPGAVLSRPSHRMGASLSHPEDPPVRLGWAARSRSIPCARTGRTGGWRATRSTATWPRRSGPKAVWSPMGPARSRKGHRRGAPIS